MTDMKTIRVSADSYVPPGSERGGYSRLRLREDVAQAWRAVREELHEAGAILTTSGGLRGLKARVGANRSATSNHYLGRAVDLYMYSGMVDPYTDPYVVVRGAGRRWRVYARAEGGRAYELRAWTYRRKVVGIGARCVDLTSIMARHGFREIPARRSFFRRDDERRDGAAEWWHFQYVDDLVVGESTFGDELLRLYLPEQLEGTPPWGHRDAVWGVDWRQQ